MNTVYSQFKQALKREGKTITTYYTNETYPCLFRINKDKNREEQFLTIFYDANTPIHQGQLLTYGGKIFITMNSESVENDIYRKSDLLECNTRVIVGINTIGYVVPCFSSDLKSPLPSEGKVITTIDGNIDLMTEDCELARNILINNRYVLMGGSYQVINKLYKAGIYYFYLQRITMAEPVYTFDLTSSGIEFKVDETTQVTALPYVDNITDPLATITYTSSDDTIATVDSNGVVTFISGGEVTITATWVEQNLSDTITFTVKEDTPTSYIITITGDWENDSTKLGLTYNATATMKDNLGNPVVMTNPVYSLNTNYSGKVVLTDNGDGTATIKVDSKAYDLVGNQYILTCMDMGSGFSNSVTLTIVGMF